MTIRAPRNNIAHREKVLEIFQFSLCYCDVDGDDVMMIVIIVVVVMVLVIIMSVRLFQLIAKSSKNISSIESKGSILPFFPLFIYKFELGQEQQSGDCNLMIYYSIAGIK